MDGNNTGNNMKFSNCCLLLFLFCFVLLKVVLYGTSRTILHKNSILFLLVAKMILFHSTLTTYIYKWRSKKEDSQLFIVYYERKSSFFFLKTFYFSAAISFIHTYNCVCKAIVINLSERGAGGGEERLERRW